MADFKVGDKVYSPHFGEAILEDFHRGNGDYCIRLLDNGLYLWTGELFLLERKVKDSKIARKLYKDRILRTEEEWLIVE